MAVKIATLIGNSDQDILHPETEAQAVYVSSGGTVEEALEAKADKSYVDSAVGALTGLSYEVVESLPTASADTVGRIYLKAHSHDSTSGQPDSYDEFITVEDGGSYSWETIGNTDIDLADYYTKSQSDGKYDAKGTASGLIAGLDATVSGLSASKTITSLTEADGKISATASNIQISEGQVTNLTSDLNSKVKTVSGTSGRITVTGGTAGADKAYTIDRADIPVSSTGTALQWGASTKVAEVDGTAISVTLPSNPNVNTAHSHASTTTITASGSGGTGGSTTFSVANHMIPNTATQLSGVDLNTVDGTEDCGFYYAPGSNNCTNKPSGVDAFGLMVMRNASGAWAQFLISSNQNKAKTYVRVNYPAGTWSAWEEFAWGGDLSAVATSGNYSDLTGKPSIPTVNNPTITFVQPGTSNQTITLNQSGAKTITFVDKDTNTSHSHTAGAGLTLSGSGGTSGTTTYALKDMTSTAIGGAKLFSDTVQTIAANAVTATASRTYGVQENSSGQLVVNVPWAKTTLGDLGVTATAAELNYMDGVTSNVQTQLNGKAASSHTHPASQVTGLTANRALISDANGHPAVSAVTSTELGYLDGVTSPIQTQLNGKQAALTRITEAEIDALFA